MWPPFLPRSAYLFFHPSSTRQHTRPLTHTSKVNPVQVSKLSIRKVSWLYEGNIHTWIWVKSPLSTFPTWVWAPEGCQVCILSREHEAAYQQWLRPCIGHPKKMLANFRPFQLGCNQLFFFFNHGWQGPKVASKSQGGHGEKWASFCCSVFRVQFPPKKTPPTSNFIPSRTKCLLMLRCPEAETMSSFNRNYLARFPGSIHRNRSSGRKNTICWGVVTGQGCKWEMNAASH